MRASFIVSLSAFVAIAGACSSDAKGGADTADIADVIDVADTAAPDVADTADVIDVADTAAPDTADTADVIDVADTAAPDTADTTADSADTSTAPTCDPYPLALMPDPSAHARAEAALATLSLTATLDWNAARGTLNGAYDLDLPLPDCVGDTNLYDQAWAKVLATPDLFQLVRAEWQQPPPAPCSIITGQIALMSFGRATLGGQPIAKDVFVFVFQRVDGVVHLKSVNGAYLPPTTPALTTALASCPVLDANAALAALAKTPLAYGTYDQCAPTGDGVYTPQAGDTIRIRGTPTWVWDDDSTSVHLSKQITATLVVAPANRTPELLSSDANCPEAPPGQGRVVGFTITLDAATGALLYSLPGIDCTVC